MFPSLDPNDLPPVVPEFRPPTYFSPVAHPPSYWRMVARRAVLRAVAGGDDLRDPAVAIGHYLGRWRRRVVELATEYYDVRGPALPVFGTRIQSLLDCPPSFVAVSPRGSSCGIGSVCPSCCGRQAADNWSRIDRDLFGEAPPRGARAVGATMVVRRATYTLPRMTPAEWDASEGNVGADYIDLDHLFNSRLCRGRLLSADGRRYRRRAAVMPTRPTEIARFGRLGVAGGLDSTRVLAVVDPEDLACWAIRFHQVLFLPTSLACRLLADPDVRVAPGIGRHPRAIAPGKVRLRRVDAPSRRDVALAVADALRYEGEAILGADRGSLAHYIAARNRRRLVAAFGDLSALRSA